MTRLPRALVAAFAFAVAGGMQRLRHPGPDPSPAIRRRIGTGHSGKRARGRGAGPGRGVRQRLHRVPGGGAAPVVRTPAVGFAGDTVVRVPVLGLDTATAYTFRVVLTLAGIGRSRRRLPPLYQRVAAGLDSRHRKRRHLRAARLPGAVAAGWRRSPSTTRGRWSGTTHSPNGTLNSFQAHPVGRYTLLGTGPLETEFRVLNSLGEQTGDPRMFRAADPLPRSADRAPVATPGCSATKPARWT